MDSRPVLGYMSSDLATGRVFMMRRARGSNRVCNRESRKFVQKMEMTVFKSFHGNDCFSNRFNRKSWTVSIGSRMEMEMTVLKSFQNKSFRHGPLNRKRSGV